MRLSMVEGVKFVFAKCAYCTKAFCTSCGAKSEPIKTHGNHYHRKNCVWYGEYNENGENEWSENCEECTKMKQCCPKPKGLANEDLPYDEVIMSSFK